jgi:alpha-tubulin suppressor-like RCC1 family protein
MNLTPNSLSMPLGWKEIDAGGTQTCALVSTGVARCWGANVDGQLGTGDTLDSPLPVTVSGLTDSVAISSGSNHVCAVVSDGTARCWGNNSWGKLGNGEHGVPPVKVFEALPVPVEGLTDVVAISAGSAHSCALLVDGTARCWGWNLFGQLGNEDSYPSFSDVPVPVTGLTGAAAISAGGGHSCALVLDGTVRCWGHSKEGQLGNGTTTDATTPVAVSGLNSAVTISAGSQHTCAALAGGDVRCWGSNESNQLGTGLKLRNSTVPVRVFGLSSAASVSAGGQHACALLRDGSARCWGANKYGQLGSGTLTSSRVPVRVVSLAGARAVTAGGPYTCARLTKGGAARCWGRNQAGQLGNGTTTNSPVPVPVG